MDIGIDNMTGCNFISEGLLEPLGCEDAVRRFNGKLKGTFNGKKRKSMENNKSAQGLADCHKLFVSHEKRALCHESNLMEPMPVVFEKLPKTSMIMLDEETIATKKKVSM